MALFDFLKRKKQVEKAREGQKKEKKPVKKTEKVLDKSKATEPKKEKQPQKVVKRGKFDYQIVKQPHISEKATDLSEKNQYTFKVLPEYNKEQIKNTVEGIYGVDVVWINLIKIPAKKRRLGKTQGFRKGYRKAIVKIKEGQKIEIL